MTPELHLDITKNSTCTLLVPIIHPRHRFFTPTVHPTELEFTWVHLAIRNNIDNWGRNSTCYSPWSQDSVWKTSFSYERDSFPERRKRLSIALPLMDDQATDCHSPWLSILPWRTRVAPGETEKTSLSQPVWSLQPLSTRQNSKSCVNMDIRKPQIWLCLKMLG